MQGRATRTPGPGIIDLCLSDTIMQVGPRAIRLCCATAWVPSHQAGLEADTAELEAQPRSLGHRSLKPIEALILSISLTDDLMTDSRDKLQSTKGDHHV